MIIDSKTPVRWLIEQASGARHIAVFLAISSGASSLISALVAYLLLGFVDIATGDSIAPFSRYIVYTVIIIISLGILYVMSSILRAKLEARTEENLRTFMLKSIFTRSFLDIQKVHTGEMMMLLSDDIATASAFLPSMVSGFFGNIVLFSAASIIMFVMNWKIALILAITIPLMMVVLNLFGPIIQKHSKKNKEDEERTRKYMQECVSNLLIFKIYSMCNKVIRNHAELYERKYRSSIRLAAFEGTSNFVNTFFTMSMFLIILGVGALLVIRGDVTVGVLVAMLNLIGNITQPFSAVSRYISQIAQAKASAERLQSITALPEEQKVKQNKVVAPALLRAKNIHFAYDEHDVLKGISIEVQRGEIVGIIGESGSGKSTLMKIIMGLYKPKNGEVSLISDSGDTTADMFVYSSYVPAENFIFTGTVKENICMNEEVNYECLKQAAILANIHDVIEKLQYGYDSQIGESSNLLSSGQAQRIGIARALYKNSPIIIFDEPTSNLDADAIEALHFTIKNIAKDKICIIVTHDAKMKSICDKVYEIS